MYVTDLIQGKATLCVVNHKTLELTRLCLRSLRRYTQYPHEILVVDNDSQDASLDYLRGLPWITLMERRPAQRDPSGAHAHGAALDMALAACRTEFFVALHSDTVVTGPDWLTELIRPLLGDAGAACAGGDKIDLGPLWRVWLKKATDLKALSRRLFADPTTRRRYARFNRTICAAYRTGILLKEGLSFAPIPEQRLTVGQALCFELQDRGYKTLLLSDRVMTRHVIHLAHATQVINAVQFGVDGRSSRRWHRTMARRLAVPAIASVLEDNSLDR
jgi:GT2 family glycosyltransferase